MMTLRNRSARVLAATALLALSACSDPAVSKQKHLERGNALAAGGKLQEAILEYRNAIKVDRQFGEARFKLAEAYAQTQNAQAAKEYIRAADLLPARPDAQVKAAVVTLMAKDFAQARKYAEAALKADPKNVDAQIVLASAFAALKDTASAVRELEEAMALAPDDARPYLNLANIKAAEGKPAEAEEMYKRAVQTDPRSVNARLALAYFYWASRRTDDAHRSIQEALSINADDLLANRMLAILSLAQNRAADAEAPLLRLVGKKDRNATLTLAELYSRTGRSAQARPLYETLKSDKKTWTIAVTRLAALDYRENKRDAAHAQIDAALKQDGKNVDLLALKARWLMQEQRLDEALALAKSAVAVNDKSASAQQTLGEVHAARGEVDAAITAYTAALAANPQLTAAQLQLSKLEMAQGKNAEALTHAVAAQKSSPRDPEVRLAVARATLANRDIQGAEAQVKALQTDYPRAAGVHALYGRVLLAKTDVRGAAREFDKALELAPSNLDALAGRLAVDVHDKRPADGRPRIERALASSPKDPKLLMLAAQFELSARDMSRAEQYLRQAVEADPSFVDAYSMLGRFYAQQNRLEEAKKEFTELVKRRPDSVAAQTMIGMILERQGRPDESIKAYESVVKNTSRAALASNNLAYLYAERGEQLDLAVQLAQSAKLQMPDSADVSDTLGWVYYKKGMAELAIRPFEFSVEKDPKNPVFAFHLGLAYAKAGRTDKARETLDRALKLQPDFPGADQARTTLASLKG